MPVNGTTLTLVILTIFLTSFAQLLQKQAAQNVSISSARSMMFNRAFIQSVVCLGISMVLWLMVLKRLDVSIAYPMLSINFILVPVLACWKFGEQIPTHRIIGSMVIIIGLTLLFTG